MRLLVILLALLIAAPCYGAAPTRQKTYTAGNVIAASDVTSNEDAIFNYLQSGVDTFSAGTIANADVKSTANIQAEKLNLTAITQNIANTGTFANTGAVAITGAIVATGANTFVGTVDVSGVASALSLHMTETTAPSTAASDGAVYTKDTGGQPELFFREESDGTEVQLTESGLVARIAWSGHETIDTNQVGSTGTTLVVDTTYQTAKDGFVIASDTADGADTMVGWAGSDATYTNNIPVARTATTAGSQNAGINFPVQKGDYWRIVNGGMPSVTVVFQPVE